MALTRQPSAPPVADPAAAVRTALDEPLRFPALRRALTPEDHVAIVLDERLPRSAELLPPVLDYVREAGIAPAAINLLFDSEEARRGLSESLAQVNGGVKTEVHDPRDRRHLSYLATTKRGRRVYLNRTAVDADQLIVLSSRRFDPLLGYSGSEAALYPALSDEATREEMFGKLTMSPPGEKPWAVRVEATEVAWLLGAPFMLQVIEGEGESLAHVLGGLTDTSADGERLLNARWRVTAEQAADTVIAGLSGDPAGHDFADLARAMACAARVVKPNGRIVVLSQAAPPLAGGAELMRQSESPDAALDLLQKQPPPDVAAAFQWANSARQAAVYLLSGLPSEVAEELFTTPLEHAGQVRRLLTSSGSCLFLPDAHKTLAVVA